MGSVPAIATPGIASFTDLYLCQSRQSRFKVMPNPVDEVLTGWVLKARNLIEVVVIQLLKQGLESLPYIVKVENPACFWIHFSCNGDAHFEGVTV